MNSIRNSEVIEKYNNKLVKLVLLNSGDFTNEAKEVAHKLNICLWDYLSAIGYTKIGNY